MRPTLGARRRHTRTHAHTAQTTDWNMAEPAAKKAKTLIRCEQWEFFDTYGYVVLDRDQVRAEEEEERRREEEEEEEKKKGRKEEGRSGRTRNTRSRSRRRSRSGRGRRR